MMQRIIELMSVGEMPDGTHVYMRPREAAGAVLGQLCYQYPRETVGVLTAAAWAGLSCYFVCEALEGEARRSVRGSGRGRVHR
jgi:hypothetical protein